MSRWTTLCAVDFDKWACATYRANFPTVDVRCSTVAEALATLPQCDVILGGPPCQPFSSAGKRAGSDDGRNGWPDMIEAVRKLQPRMFLAENVPGMLTEKMLPYARKVFAELTACGYHVEKRSLNAVHFGVPQVRERVWLWGIRNDVWASGVRHKWPEPTHYYDQNTRNCTPPPMMRGILLSAVTVGQALGSVSGAPRGHERGSTKHPRSGGQGSGANTVVVYRWSPAMLVRHPPAHPAHPAHPAQTVQAKWFKGGAEGLLAVDSTLERPADTITNGGTETGGADPITHAKRQGYVRRLSPAECARLQSCPDDMIWPKGISKTAMYRVVGNGWACGIAAALSGALADADPQSRTVVDLFAGGGLGALGWHQRYWQFVPLLEDKR